MRSGEQQGQIAQAGQRKGRKVLVLATGRWFSTAQLAMAFAGLGCEVELMGQRTHPAMAAGIVGRRYGYNPLRPLASLREAMLLAKPDVVVPADELAVLHLEELRQGLEGHASGEERGLQELIERSIGGPAVMTVGRSRIALMRVAVQENVATPETMALPLESDVEKAVARLGLPLMLKADATSGGRGVKLVESLEAARRVWWTLRRPPTAIEAARRGLVWGEWTHVRPWRRKETRDVAAQRLVKGKERTAMAVAHRGEVLVCVCLEVVQTRNARGPSSVVRVVEDAAMESALRRVAKNVGVSGFCGFDFMVEESTGQALLLEMNLRPTQLVHLPLGPGRDLVAAYARAVLGMDVQDRRAATEKDLIALFPKELERDPQSRLIETAFHDVPWDAPELVKWAIKPVPKVVRDDPRWNGGR